MSFANKVFDIPELKEIIMEFSYEPKTYTVFEGDAVSVFCLTEKCNKYDRINYQTYNQMGCVLYEIRIDENNKKYLHQLWSADDDDF
tara:strand:- start:2504 stop:2764 length:261 start_codon:yes stop_codon:yes gene_type:complete